MIYLIFNDIMLFKDYYYYSYEKINNFIKYVLSFVPYNRTLCNTVFSIFEKFYFIFVTLYWKCCDYVYPIYKYNLLPLFKEKRIVSYVNQGYEFDEMTLLKYGLDLKKYDFKMVKDYNIETCGYDMKLYYSDGEEYINTNIENNEETTYKFISIFYTDINSKKTYEIKLNHINNYYFVNNIVLNIYFLKWYLNTHYLIPISNYYNVTIIDNNVTEIKLWKHQSILLLKDEYKIINDKDIVIELKKTDMENAGDNIKSINGNERSNYETKENDMSEIKYSINDNDNNVKNYKIGNNNYTTKRVNDKDKKVCETIEETIEEDIYDNDNQTISNLAKIYVKPPYKLYSMDWDNTNEAKKNN